MCSSALPLCCGERHVGLIEKSGVGRHRQHRRARPFDPQQQAFLFERSEDIGGAGDVLAQLGSSRGAGLQQVPQERCLLWGATFHGLRGRT